MHRHTTVESQKSFSSQQFSISMEARFIRSSTLPPKAGEDVTPLVQYSLILLFIYKIWLQGSKLMLKVHITLDYSAQTNLHLSVCGIRSVIPPISHIPFPVVKQAAVRHHVQSLSSSWAN